MIAPLMASGARVEMAMVGLGLGRDDVLEPVGSTEVIVEGNAVSEFVGKADGLKVGLAVGLADGSTVGLVEGA